MARNIYLSALLAGLAAAFAAAPAVGQTDSANFHVRAVGGADMRQAIPSSLLMPQAPTTAAWMARAAGKHFGVSLEGIISPGSGPVFPGQSIIIELHHDGAHATIRRMVNGHQMTGGVIAHWSSVFHASGDHVWPGHIQGSPVRVQLTPAGVEITPAVLFGPATCAAEACGTPIVAARGLIPADYLINRPGGWLAPHEVF